MPGGAGERIFGRNAVYEVLRGDRRRVSEIDVAEGAEARGTLKRLLDLAAQRGIPVRRVPRRDLDRQSDSHQGVGASVGAYPYVTVHEVLEHASQSGEPPFLLVLDLIQNPQNLGALLRSAEAVGVHGVLLAEHRAVGITPAVVSSSAGACEHLHVARGNLAQAMRALREAGVWLVGLEAGPESRLLDTVDLRGPLGLVIGNEGEGLRRLVRESCDVLAGLPMRGRVDSLNAAVAGSLALYAAWAARGYAGRRPSAPGVGYIDGGVESC
jgi:23S rRNA (guanosine2251-2'-O)-methyltransferase